MSVERLLEKPAYVHDIDSSFHTDDLLGEVLRGLEELEGEAAQPSDLTAPVEVVD